MREIGLDNPREWVIDWFINQYNTTREYVESSNCLSEQFNFDDLDRLLFEVDAENNACITIQAGSFNDCDTLDSLVAKLTEILNRES